MKYYKVKENSKTAQLLEGIFAKMKECNAAARQLMNDVGAVRLYRSSFEVAGGAYCFIFPNTPPAGWIRKASGYYPKRMKSNLEILERIEKLPVVGIIEWSDIFGCELPHTPGCFKHDGTYFAHGIGIKGDDFEEIKMSEWALAQEAFELKFQN